MKLSKRAKDYRPMIPQGVKCYFGEEVNQRRKVESILAGIMKNWSFQEIILPFFDYLEDFSYGLGSQLGDRVYRFLDRDGSLLALRPDLTTLVAKTVATRMTDQPLPIKLFYSGEVFRQERAGAGKQKEYYQVGLETLGAAGSWADIEAILIAMECFLHLKIGGFKVVLGHAGFFNGIVSGLELSHRRADALRDAIDHKDCAWLQKEVALLDLSEEKKRFLMDLPNYAGGREVLERALSAVQNPRSREALMLLDEIHSVVSALGLENFLTFDLSEVRGFDYYTGIVFKIYSSSVGFELGGGGRYDTLLAKFDWDLPAVGFSMTLDRVIPLARGLGNLDVPPHEAGEPTAVSGGASVQDMFCRAWDLRRQGHRVRLVGEA